MAVKNMGASAEGPELSYNVRCDRMPVMNNGNEVSFSVPGGKEPSTPSPVPVIVCSSCGTGDQRLIIMVVELTPIPEGWPDGSTFTNEYSGIQEEDYFACGAVELAKKLVGEWLYCHRTEIAVRILETEAYPEDEVDVYRKVFVSPQAFKVKAGQILACKRDGTRVRDGTRSSGMNQVFLYITAGADNSGDVVLLRSCCPVQGHHLIEENCEMLTSWSLGSKINILVNPFKVSQGLNNEWEDNPYLYQEFGVQLYGSNRPQEKVLLIGTRHLPNDIPPSVGRRNYRFALETFRPAYSYYKKGETLTLREVIPPSPPKPEPGDLGTGKQPVS